MTKKELVIALAEYESVYRRHNTDRLYRCKATVIECGHGIALQSYNTIVAWYSYDEEELVLFDYYSAATCQHMNKFAKWLRENGNRVDNVYRLWKTRYPFSGSREQDGSRTFTKEQWNNVIESGYGIWIDHIPTYWLPSGVTD